MNRPYAWLIGLGLMALSALGYAGSCGLDGSADTRVRVGGEEISGSAYIEDCRELEVIQGPVRVCHVDRLLRRVCKPLKSGERLAADEIGVEQSSGLLVLFQALPVRRAGGSRGVGDDFPSGLVLPYGGDLVFKLGSGTVRASVVDAETKEVVVEAAAGASTMVLPRKLLKYGKNYRWVVRGVMGVQQGIFSLPTRKVETELKASLQRTQSSGDERSVTLARVIILLENGFEFDAQLEMD